MKLKVSPEYENLLPKLPRDEYQALKESIRREEQHYPIVTNEKGIILDGHQRYRICLELGVEPKWIVKTFSDPLVERKFVIEANLRRRHLNKFQRFEMALPLLEIERKLAKQRMSEAGKVGRDMQLGVSSNELTPEFDGQARDVVAKKIGLSPTTFQRALTVHREGSEKLKHKLRRGEISINAAYIQVKRAEKHNDPPSLPEGKFDVIYADPAWKYDFCLEGDPRQHYPTMSIEKICSLEIPAADDAVLFLWVTNPKLEDGLKVVRAWGFEYKTNIVWVKDRDGLGYYLKGKHELLLIAKRGSIPPPSAENRPPSVLEAKQREHSCKPDEVYKLIETMYPNRRYLELFARPKQKRRGWVYWGLDVNY